MVAILLYIITIIINYILKNYNEMIWYSGVFSAGYLINNEKLIQFGNIMDKYNKPVDIITHFIPVLNITSLRITKNDFDIELRKLINELKANNCVLTSESEERFFYDYGYDDIEIDNPDFYNRNTLTDVTNQKIVDFNSVKSVSNKHKYKFKSDEFKETINQLSTEDKKSELIELREYLKKQSMTEEISTIFTKK